eukprot:TRINITY_DN6286_c0_g1_i1.p1 TRINITY_DN6286_c0_g1~~TRINITY_DN6286_c0_g1_i1.p1  ORF type:complete len:134 (-),score=8.48 TRINITY_DN6286_c0_g1_i1:79-480(-)
MRFGSSDIVFASKNCSSDNRDSVSRGSVVACHFHVELTDCTIQRNISVFFVHVMNSGSGLIPEDNAESFNVVWPSFKNLINRQYLSLGALCLELSSKMIPEFGFSDNIIGSKKTDGINLGVWVLLSGKLSSHN